MAGSRSRLILTALVCSLLTLIFLTQHHRIASYPFTAPLPSTLALAANSQFNFSALELREGITVFGDSYSVNTAQHWTNYVEKNISQIFAIQGASVDNRLIHGDLLSKADFADLAEDLTTQINMMTTYCTKTVIIWFGINDLMTLHHWGSQKIDTIKAEHGVIFSFVEALIDLGVRQIIIPKTIDFTPSPGLSLARDAGQMVAEATTRSAIEEWNQSLDDHLISKLPQVETIDFFHISQDWYARYDHYGLRSLLNVEEVKSYDNYMWADFLHLTPFVHRTLIAPHFNALLAEL